MFRWGKKSLGLLGAALGLALLAGLGIRGVATIRWGMKECLVWYGNNLPTRFPLNSRESQNIQAQLHRFGTEIHEGRRPLMAGWALLRAMESGPLGAFFWINGFTSVLIRDSVLGPAEFAGFQIDSARFLNALQAKKVASASVARVRSLVVEEKVVWSRTPSGFIFPETSDAIRDRFLARDAAELSVIMKTACPPDETGDSASATTSPGPTAAPAPSLPPSPAVPSGPPLPSDALQAFIQNLSE